jgi:hypothetical protein
MNKAFTFVFILIFIWGCAKRNDVTPDTSNTLAVWSITGKYLDATSLTSTIGLTEAVSPWKDLFFTGTSVGYEYVNYSSQSSSSNTNLFICTPFFSNSNLYVGAKGIDFAAGQDSIKFIFNSYVIDNNVGVNNINNSISATYTSIAGQTVSGLGTIKVYNLKLSGYVFNGEGSKLAYDTVYLTGSF